MFLPEVSLDLRRDDDDEDADSPSFDCKAPNRGGAAVSAARPAAKTRRETQRALRLDGK